MSNDWLIAQLHWSRPGFWLLLSFAGSILLLSGSRLISPRTYSQLRMGRWLLIPYLGMLVGGLSPRLMGLSDIDWLAGLGMGVALIFAVLVILVLIRATLDLDHSATQASPVISVPTVVEQVWLAGAQEFHWTFLRAATWELMMLSPIPLVQPDYWSIWIASILALPGIFVQYQRTSPRLIACVVLVTTAIVYFYTRNFWLTWFLHTAIQFLLGQRAVEKPGIGAPQTGA